MRLKKCRAGLAASPWNSATNPAFSKPLCKPTRTSSQVFYYCRNINSGHPGSITSIHAASCELAFEQLILLVKESPAAKDLSRVDILQLLHRVIDVVVQFQVSGSHRSIREIWYRGNQPQPDP